MEDNPHIPKDEEIVRRVVAGDINAFEHLVMRYKNLVLTIAAKHVPFDQMDDISQDVFLRAFRSLPTFRGEEGFKSWLSVIAVRTCYDFWREHYKSREFPISSFSDNHQAWLEAALSDQSDQSFLEKGSAKEAREILDRGLDRLSPADRMVLELVHLEGRSVKEAAGLMGLTITTVKVRLFRSRKKLHNILATITKYRRSDV